MVRASITRRTTDGTSGAAALEIIAGLKGFFLRSVSISLPAATACLFQLGRPTAKGITPGAVANLFVESDANGGASTGNAQTTTALSWGTGPTAPSRFFRATNFPAVIGTRDGWTFTSPGIWCPPGLTLVVWNSAANALVDIFMEVDEVQN